MSGHTAPITFRDVTAYFSEEEWKLLHEWQKEVYNNVMKDIQQILVSLGPLIASSVFSLRANNKEDLCCMERDNSESRHTVEHTPSCFMVNSDDLLTKNHEENQYLIVPPDTQLAEKDDCIRSGFGPFISTIVLRQEHKDSLEDYPGADGEDIHTDDKIEDVGITQIVSYRVKEEGGGYSSSGQGSKTKSNTNIPTGIGSIQKYDRIEETDTNVFYSTDTLPRETNEAAYPHSWTKEYDKTSSNSQRRRRTPRESRRTQCTGNEIAARTSQKTSGKQQTKTTAARGYPCSECGKSFTTKPSRTIHLRTHTGEKPYKCNVCGKCFSESSKLIRHCRIHTGFKPYKCNECGKCFNQSSTLVSHKNTHTGVKPYTCGQCGKSFARNSTLTAHVRRHKGGKSYSCRECRQSFNQLSSLLSHNQTHVKNKPYTCRECGKSFTQNSTLGTHLRTHIVDKRQ